MFHTHVCTGSRKISGTQNSTDTTTRYGRRARRIRHTRVCPQRNSPKTSRCPPGHVDTHAYRHFRAHVYRQISIRMPMKMSIHASIHMPLHTPIRVPCLLLLLCKCLRACPWMSMYTRQKNKLWALLSSAVVPCFDLVSAVLQMQCISMHMSIHVCAYVYAHLSRSCLQMRCKSAHVNTHVCTHVCTCLHADPHACLYTCRFVSTHMSLHISIYMSIHMPCACR